MRHAFTLIELMIVIAIIGILAAISIPLFSHYIKSSKTSEAKINLDSLQKRAQSFFSTEHYENDGMTTRTHYYPESDSVTGIGKAADATTIGLKYSPLEYNSVLNSVPWSQLQFSIISPFYYYYMYNSQNGSIPSFQISASASLDLPCDSIMIMNGDSDAVTSNVIDLSADSSKCNQATAPTKTE